MVTQESFGSALTPLGQMGLQGHVHTAPAPQACLGTRSRLRGRHSAAALARFSAGCLASAQTLPSRCRHCCRSVVPIPMAREQLDLWPEGTSLYEAQGCLNGQAVCPTARNSPPAEEGRRVPHKLGTSLSEEDMPSSPLRPSGPSRLAGVRAPRHECSLGKRVWQ